MSGTRRLRILLVGVGGQGVVTAAEVLGLAVRAAGLEVNVGQLHGMAQRGGSVEATVVIGPGATAFVGAAEADVLIGFEPLETLRALPRVHAGSVAVMNTEPLPPFALAQAGTSYPDVATIVERVREAVARLVSFDGPAVTREAGDRRSLNVAMLGALAGLGVVPIDRAALEAAVLERYPPRSHSANVRALRLGARATEEQGARTP